jgi:hypothetical protein
LAKSQKLNKVGFGTHRSTLESHLAESMWLQKFGKDFDMFLRFMLGSPKKKLILIIILKNYY